MVLHILHQDCKWFAKLPQDNLSVDFNRGGKLGRKRRARLMMVSCGGGAAAAAVVSGRRSAGETGFELWVAEETNAAAPARGTLLSALSLPQNQISAG